MGVFNKGPKEHVETVDSNTGSTKPQRRGCKGFCRRWWWAILIVLAIVTLVVMLCIFLVAIPKVIQKKVDDSVLHVDSIKVTNTKSDEVTLEIDSWVDASDSIHATIDAFTADMYLEDKKYDVNGEQRHVPFAQLEMPQTKTGISIVNVTQTINTSGDNMQAFVDYNIELLSQESVRMTVKGQTKVRVKGLKAESVNFEKTIELKGLNSFNGLEVTKSRIDLKPDSRGNNFFGFADVPNPSILSLDIGNATFANMLNGTEIGELFIDDMQLVPGVNNLSIRATIDQFPVLEALGKEGPCETGVLAFELVGTSVVNKGENLTYFAKALSTAKQHVNIDVGTPLKETFGGKSPYQCPAGSKRSVRLF